MNVMTQLEALLDSDPGKRGIAALRVPGDLGRAEAALRKASRVLILTGFAVGPAGVAETDGPPGALFLARALDRLGKAVLLATHACCEPVLAAGKRSLGLNAGLAPFAPDDDPLPLLNRYSPDLVVAIELPGQAADGDYYNMRGLSISHRIARLDRLVAEATRRGVPTIAVGDGGNEAGMGKVLDRVRTAIPNGARIGAVVPADCLIASGTSNWGAYGLIAALGSDLLHGPEEEVALLEVLVAAGALDGVHLEPRTTVDAVEPHVYLQMLGDLKRTAAT